jgi:bacteriocin-like protein
MKPVSNEVSVTETRELSINELDSVTGGDKAGDVGVGIAVGVALQPLPGPTQLVAVIGGILGALL